jgi:hypothetical protein
MNRILGFAQVLEMDALDPEPEDSVAQIVTSVAHLLTLIPRIFAISDSRPEHLGFFVHETRFTLVPACPQKENADLTAA